MANINEEIAAKTGQQLKKTADELIQIVRDFLDSVMKKLEKDADKKAQRMILEHYNNGGSFCMYQFPASCYKEVEEVLKRYNIPMLAVSEPNSATKLAIIREQDIEEVNKLVDQLKAQGKIMMYNNIMREAPVELLLSPNEKCIVLSDLSEDEKDSITGKTFDKGCGFSVATNENPDGMYEIFAKADNAYTFVGEKKMDIVTAQTKAFVSLYGQNNELKKKNLAYDRKLINDIKNLYNNQQSFKQYYVSATNNNRFIQLTEKGYIEFIKKDGVFVEHNSKDYSKTNAQTFFIEFDALTNHMTNCALINESQYNLYSKGAFDIESHRAVRTPEEQAYHNLEKGFVNHIIQEKKMEVEKKSLGLKDKAIEDANFNYKVIRDGFTDEQLCSAAKDLKEKLIEINDNDIAKFLSSEKGQELIKALPEGVSGRDILSNTNKAINKLKEYDFIIENYSMERNFEEKDR